MLIHNHSLKRHRSPAYKQHPLGTARGCEFTQCASNNTGVNCFSGLPLMFTVCGLSCIRSFAAHFDGLLGAQAAPISPDAVGKKNRTTGEGREESLFVHFSRWIVLIYCSYLNSSHGRCSLLLHRRNLYSLFRVTKEPQTPSSSSFSLHLFSIFFRLTAIFFFFQFVDWKHLAG